MAAIFGDLIVSWIYGGIGPEAFLSRLQTAIGMNTFLVGLIKAPFMALVIALVGAMEASRSRDPRNRSASASRLRW